VTIQVVVAYQSHIPTLTFGLDRFDFSSHNYPPFKVGSLQWW
jgi:hypothetical protein